MINFKFLLVPLAYCTEKESVLVEMQLKVVNGMFRVQAVIGLGDLQIKVMDVSCFCDICLTGHDHTPRGYTVFTLCFHVVRPSVRSSVCYVLVIAGYLISTAY